MSDAIRLEADALYRRCDPDQFSFQSTSELEDLDDVPGQQRAIEAIRFGIGIRREGYNLYALGVPGAGRHALIERYLRERAAAEPSPPDWVYVYNFDETHKPRALELPAGRGVRLRDDMQQLMEDLQVALPAAFESEDYRARRKELEDRLEEQQGAPLEQLNEKAKERGLLLIRTPSGMAFAPMTEEREVMPPDEFNKLPEDERDKVRKDIEELEDELEKIFHRAPRWQHEAQRKIRELDREITGVAVDNLMEDMRKGWHDLPAVQKYLDAVRDDVIENAGDFLGGDEAPQAMAMFGMARQNQRSLRRFQVNVLVDNSITQGAPIIFENHASHQHLFGRIEHLSQMGNLFTDFTLIKAGALHRANRGYLVVEARKLLSQPFAWESLKRALFSSEVRVETLEQELSLVSTVSLEPEALKLDVKVILVGSRQLYQLLSHYDPEFAQLFKVAADFEENMGRDIQSQDLFARMIATLLRKEQLLPLDPEATARVIEHSAREANDAEKLSVHVQSITDLLREADFWAREQGRGMVCREDVQQAVAARRYRAGRVPEKIQEAIQRGTLLIATAGERIGQVNALSVSNDGQMSFGHAMRITARVRLGKGEVKDIQREVKLAGPIFSKAVMTLTGYLGAHYAPDFPLLVAASLVFEQTYGGIEGDSATLAELIALLSALGEVPVRQSLAITGSANQYGEAQAIGGVNEKIEGFFDTCDERGLTGEQGVLIPEANIKHLMLREDVVEAVRAGKFHIYAVADVDAALSLMTGMHAGDKDQHGRFPEDSVNDRVQQRLLLMADQTQQWSKGASGDNGGEA